MLPSNDSVAFGYADFYNAYLAVPYFRALVELSGTPLPSPAVFSILDPLHVALAAKHGHQIFPADETSVKARVKDGAPYSVTVESRMAEFETMVATHNAEQERTAMFRGGSVKILIEDTPFTIEEFEDVGLGDSFIAQAAMQFEQDRAFFRLGHSGRLNHFAREYGFANLRELLVHIQKLDHAAQLLGASSYATLCATSRYIDQVLAQSEGDPEMTETAAALREQRALLTRESVFMVDRFVACRVASGEAAYFIEARHDGVCIELRRPPYVGKGIVSSKRQSDKEGQIVQSWFA